MHTRTSIEFFSFLVHCIYEEHAFKNDARDSRGHFETLERLNY